MEPNPPYCGPSELHQDDSGSLDDGSFCGEPRGRCYTWPALPYPTQIGLAEPGQQCPPGSSSQLPSLTSLSPPGVTALGQFTPHFGEFQATDTDLSKPAKPKRIRRRTDGGLGTGKKPNPWGEESYSDLIARSLFTANEGRLKLNEIYQWFIDNIPYFTARSSQEEAQGWKNSIRHNLSLHSRFMRIQNEGAGKSSWWVINPDAKPGRNPRRRANTMENASKAAMDKKRRGARKRVEQLVQQKNGGQPGPSTSAMASMQELFEGAEEATEMGGGGQGGSSSSSGANFDTFRPRAQSTLSVTGPSRLSPKLEPTGFEDFDFPPWMDQSSNGGTQKQPQQQLNPQVNELLDRTDQMRLDGQAAVPIMNGIKMESIAGTTGPLLVPKSEVMEPPSDVKQEPGVGNIPPPPSYQELSAVRRPVQLQSNPLLRQLDGSPQQQMMSPLKMTPASMSGVGQQVQAPPTMPIFTHVPFGAPNASFPQQWNPPMSTATSSAGHQMMMAAPPQYMGLANGGALPLDLENVNGLDQSLLTDLDVDAVLRHELAQGGQFDLP